LIIKGATSGNGAEVDSYNNLKVNLPTVLSGAGYVNVVAEVDDGSITGTKIQRKLDSSQDNRLRVGVDKILWQDTFSHATFNTSKYLGVTSTMTMTLAGGFLNINAGNALASGNVARFQTFRTFSLFNTYPVYLDLKAKFSNTFQANSVFEYGFGFAATTAVPTDGVFFRVVGGQLLGVINSNGAEETVALPFTPTPNRVYQFSLNMSQNLVSFWIDGKIYGRIETPTGLGSLVQSNALPLLIRGYNSGVVASAIQMNISTFGVTQSDMDMTKDWAYNMVTNGQSSISAPDGAAAAFTANLANNTAPVSAALSNTTAGYATLGGQFQFAAVAGAETDYALFAYLNPAGTSAIPGKTLVITGVRIDTLNNVAAVATTATVLQWAIAVGSTAVSLATTDSATAGTRAPRRLPLGVQTMPIGTTVGAMATPTIDVKFSTPLMVEAGTYCHIILRMPIATATATEILRGVVMINGYFE
jgi:hypothetical protein